MRGDGGLVPPFGVDKNLRALESVVPAAGADFDNVGDDFAPPAGTARQGRNLLRPRPPVAVNCDPPEPPPLSVEN